MSRRLNKDWQEILEPKPGHPVMDEKTFIKEHPTWGPRMVEAAKKRLRLEQALQEQREQERIAALGSPPVHLARAVAMTPLRLAFGAGAGAMVGVTVFCIGPAMIFDLRLRGILALWGAAAVLGAASYGINNAVAATAPPESPAAVLSPGSVFTTYILSSLALGAAAGMGYAGWRSAKDIGDAVDRMRKQPPPAAPQLKA